MDTHALHAHQEKFNTNNLHMMLKVTWTHSKAHFSTTMLNNASDQVAMESMIFNLPWTTNPVEDANNANGQDKFQTLPEQLVSLDHLLNAQIASPEDLLKDTPVNNAHQDKFKIHPTWPDVSPDHALVNTRLLLLMTLNHVEDVKPANGQDKCQINSNLFALTDHSPFAVAEKSNQLTDTLVNHAQLDPFKMLTTHRDALDHLAMVNTRSNFQSMPTAVEDVILANGQHSCQTQQETNVWKDQLLSAEHVPKDNLMMDIHVLLAQLDKFNSKHPHMMLKVTWSLTNSVNSPNITQDNASNQLVVENMTFNSQWTTNHAEDVNHANGQDKFQISKELLVSPDH